MWAYLIKCLLLALLVGVPTVVIRLWSDRRLSWQESYLRALLHIARVFSAAFALVSGIILLCVLADLIGMSKFGYPSYSVLATAIFIIIGYGLWRLTSWGLNWHTSKHRNFLPDAICDAVAVDEKALG